MPGARSRRVIAAAAFLLGAALLYAAAPAGSERFFSEHLQAEVVVFPGVHWSSPGEGESTSQAERHVLPFMRLHGEVFRGKKVLDIGCGSGVIALYAAKLGAESVVATDIDPRALENTRFNARRLGFAKKIETRLVRPEDPGAFAVARPGEVFDVIVSNPPWQVDPELKSIRLGLSIVDGLGDRLAPGGRAILLYRARYLHELMVRAARGAGHDVEHHLAVAMFDWPRIFNLATQAVSRNLGVNILPRLEAGDALPSPDVFGTEQAQIASPDPVLRQPLWDKSTERAFPGMIVIRRKS